MLARLCAVVCVIGRFPVPSSDLDAVGEWELKLRGPTIKPAPPPPKKKKKKKQKKNSADMSRFWHKTAWIVPFRTCAAMAPAF